MKVVFIGSKHLGLEALEITYSISPESLAEVITIDDRDDIRCKLDEFRGFSKKTGIELCVLKQHSRLHEQIKRLKPDICIVVGWYWLLEKELLAIPPAGFMGIHGSLLPEYRGGAPLVWPIIKGEKESGVTLFYLNSGMDSGDIIAQNKFTIEETDYIENIMNKAKQAIIDMLRKAYPLILSGNAPRRKQDESKASYCTRRVAEDGKIDWNLPAREVYNFIRAQSHPYPGAFCYMEDGTKMYIWKARLFEKKYLGIPGLVAKKNDDEVIVTCADGAVCLQSVQKQVNDEVNAAELLKFGQILK